MTRVPRRGRVCAVAALLGSIVAVGAAPVQAAGEVTPTSTTPQLQLVSQSPFVYLGGRFHARLLLADATSEPTVTMTIHNRIDTMEAFDAAARDDAPRLGEVPDTPVTAQLEHVGRGTYLASVELQAPGEPMRKTTLTALEPGVYPLEIALGASGEPASATVVTWLVTAARDRPVAGVELSWIWQVSAPPLRDLDSDANVIPSEFAPGGRLATIADLLDETRAAPITLRVTPETAATWDALASRRDQRAVSDSFAGLAAAATNPLHQLLPAAYVDLDAPAVVAEGLGTALSAQLRDGTRTLETTFETKINRRVSYAESADRRSLRLLSADGAARVGLAAGNVATSDGVYQPFAVRGSTLVGALSNGRIAQLLDGNASAAVRVQRYLAALALIALDSPDDASGVVLATPLRWKPDPALVRTLLRNTAHNPYVRLSTLEDWFVTLGAGRRKPPLPVLALAALPRGTLAVTLPEYEHAVAQSVTLRNLAGLRSPEVVAAQRSIDLSPGIDATPASVAADFARIDLAAANSLTGISTQSRTVTITARRSNIPLSFTNTTNRRVRVRVTLESPKLLFPSGNTKIVLLPATPANSTAFFEVEVRASGQFPVDVTIASANGSSRLPSTQITVNSAVFGSFGSLITIGALSFLALWWGNHFRRTRRDRRNASPAPA